MHRELVFMGVRTLSDKNRTSWSCSVPAMPGQAFRLTFCSGNGLGHRIPAGHGETEIGQEVFQWNGFVVLEPLAGFAHGQAVFPVKGPSSMGASWLHERIEHRLQKMVFRATG